jgi:hypothetical protein
MNKEFVSYEHAVALKELGFDEECFSFFEDVDVLYNSEGTYKYNDNVWEESEVIAPLKQQVFRWFREKYGVYPTIMTEIEDDSLYFRFIAEGGPEWLSFSKIYYTYEEAENACIDKLIELAKQS